MKNCTIQISFADTIITASAKLSVEELYSFLNCINTSNIQTFNSQDKLNFIQSFSITLTDDIPSECSKLITQIITVIDLTLKQFPSKTPIAFTLFDTAIKKSIIKTSNLYSVSFSTCHDKCTRKLGLSSRVDFSKLVFDMYYSNSKILINLLTSKVSNGNNRHFDLNLINTKFNDWTQST